MSVLPAWWHREPVRFWGALVVFVNSLITLAQVLHVIDLDATQLAVIYLVVLNGAVLIGGEAVRSRVSPSGSEPAEGGE